MSYHGLGFELSSGGTVFKTPVSSGVAKVTSGAVTASVAWRYFLAVQGLLAQSKIALARIRGRVAAADRTAATSALNAATAAAAAADSIYNYETLRGTRAFVAWSSSSLSKLGDIARSGGIPTAATLTMIERSRDAVAINVARELQRNWAIVAQSLGSVSGPKLLTSSLISTSLVPGAGGASANTEAAEAERQRLNAIAAAEEQRKIAAILAMEEERQRQAIAAEQEAARQRQGQVDRDRVQETVQQTAETVQETVDDVIQEAQDQLGPLPTMEQITPGTSAPGLDRKWLYIGAGVLGLGAVGYLILKD